MASRRLAWRLAPDVVITVLAFSAIEVVSRPIRADIDPLALTWWRFALAALLLGPFAGRAVRERWAGLTGRDLIQLAALGALNVIVAMGAHAVCIKHARASTAAVLIASNPLATNLLAAWWLRERLGWRRWVALAAGVAGVALIAGASSHGEDTGLGLAAGVVGLVGFGAYTVLGKSAVSRFGGMTVTVVGFALAVAIQLPLLLLAGVPVWPRSELWPRLLFLGLVVSGLGYVTFFRVLAALPAGRTSLLFFAKPPVSLWLAWLLLGEVPTAATLAGTALVMLGIATDVWGRDPR